MSKKLDKVYSQRALAACVAVELALCLGFEAGVSKDTENSDGWDNVLMIVMPNKKQISWHISPEDAHLILKYPAVDSKWDGTFYSRETNKSTLEKLFNT